MNNSKQIGKGKRVELIEEGHSVSVGEKGEVICKGNTQNETKVRFDNGYVLSVKTAHLKVID